MCFMCSITARSSSQYKLIYLIGKMEQHNFFWGKEGSSTIQVDIDYSLLNILVRNPV